MANPSVTLSLALDDKATPQLQTFRRSFQTTMQEVKSKGSGGFAQLATDVSSAGGALTMLGAAAPQVAAVMLAVQGLGQAVEAGRVAANVQMIEASFSRMAATLDVSGSSMLASLRTVSAGMIAESDLMLAANKAMVLNVADSAETMTRLLEVAIARGADLGLAPTQAFNDLVSGLGRGEAEILDNLGIIVDATATYKEYAESINVTVDALSKKQRTQALVNAVLAATPDAAGRAAEVGESAAAAFARWDAATKDFSETFGAVFLPAITTGLDLVTRFVNGVAAIPDVLGGKIDLSPEDIRSQIAEHQRMIAEFSDPNKYFQSNQTANQVAYHEDQIRMLEQALRLLTDNTAAAGELTAATARTKDEQYAYNQSLWDGQAAWSAFAVAGQTSLTAAADAAAQIQAIAQSGLAGIAQSIAAVQGTDAAVGWLRGANAQLERQIGLWMEAGYSIGEITGVLLPQWLSNLDGIIAKTQAAYTATASSIDVKAVADGAASGLDRMAQALAQVSGADRAFAWLDDAQGKIEAMIGQWARQGYTIEQITGVLLPNYVATLDQIVQREIQAAEFGAQIGTRIAAGLNVAIGAANTLMGALGSALGFTVEAINGIANSAMPSLTSAASGYVDAMGPDGALGWLQEQKSATEGQIASWMQAGYTVEEIQGVLLPAYLTKLRTANSELKTMGGGVSTVADGFDDLRGKVQSIISGATTLDFGLDPANFLPREDAINENARRLGAIMRDGIAGQDWLEEFKSEVPALWEELSSSGDPKGAAARMLQEFQQGLRPELLDKDMIKARVKAMLLGEENTAALAAEIAAELSGELGMSLAQAQQAVAGVMGAGVGGLAGGMTGGGQVGPDGAAQGTQFVAAWAGMVKSQLTEFENTGKQAGSSWGAGFMATVEGGVPGQLIALLVTLVTPGVLANMAAQGSRTGAQ